MSRRDLPVPQIRLYQEWLREHRGLSFKSYDELWRWSVEDLEAFWQSIWDCFGYQSPTPHRAVLADARMPGAVWFPGAQVNYARQVLRHVEPAHAAGFPAIVSRNERGQHRELSWPELRRQVASVALHLKAQGLKPGDRVAAYLPNVPEAIVAFLAVVSLGGIWSICAPDMGTNAVLDRFRQIEPSILIACDGVTYGHKDHDRSGVVDQLREQLPTVRHVLGLRTLGGTALRPDAWFDEAAARDDAQTTAFEPMWLPFDHPVWIVYSSGTTGLPKPIVHGHGGILLVMQSHIVLHSDVGCSYHPNTWGERFHWYSSTGWVMWNAQMSGLLSGTTCCIYDGNPAGAKEAPDWSTLWRFGAEVGATFFGAGAAFFANCMKAGVDLRRLPGLKSVRALGTTGSPLSAEVQRWVNAQFEAIGKPGMWWSNISGGTDFAGAFIGGHRELPLVPGQMQCRLLGCSVEAWNEQGQPVIDEVGELVCTRPIPSMPLYFWNDEGHKRYLSSYFDTWPGVWRHGDWLRITREGGCVIYGRSDATINRHGLRMGTAELYSAVEALPEVLDSMVVDLEYLGRESWMPLFVVLRPGVTLDDALRAKINGAIRHALSPRFVPDEIFQVAEIPRTLTGKKQELPVKKLLLGHPIEKVVNKDAMANPGCLDWYVELARQRQAGGRAVIRAPFELRPIGREDYPQIAHWLRQPHVARWWCDSPEPEALEAEYGGVIDGREPAHVFIASREGRPVGLVQRFPLDGYPDYRDEVAAWTSVPANAWSLDYFLGEPWALRRGWGTQVVAKLAAGIFADHPQATAILVPVHADNRASWRVLERSGFRHVADGEFEPDNPIDTRQHRIYRRDRG